MLPMNGSSRPSMLAASNVRTRLSPRSLSSEMKVSHSLCAPSSGVALV